MGLDISFTVANETACPHCGGIIFVCNANSLTENSCGRGWYPILEELGYYVPYDQRTEENDWYGKDMTLTKEQVEKVYQFIIRCPGLYRASAIRGLISMAILDGDAVILNADW